MPELVRKGSPLFCVEVRPPQDAEALRHVLSDLVIHLEACLGSPVPWFDRWAKARPPVRLVLVMDVTRDIDRQAFEIVADSASVALCASSVQGMGYGVHYFLERAFGVRWLWPGESGTVTPRSGDVAWPVGTTRHAPDWLWRRLWVGGSFWREDDAFLAELKFGQVSPGTLEAMRLRQWRNRLGGLNIADGHRWAQICSPLHFAAQPGLPTRASLDW